MEGGKYFALLIILGLSLFAIIKMGFRVNFLGELLVFALFLIASLGILSAVYKGRNHGMFTSVFFIISLINLFYIKSAFAASPNVNAGIRGWLLFGAVLFLNAAGFLLGAVSIRPGMTQKEKDGIIEKKIEPKIREMEEKLGDEVKEAKIETEFYPGKFLASKTGSVYHTAKCDWAKKISKKSQIWFQSKEEAKKAGYKQHSCLRG